MTILTKLKTHLYIDLHDSLVVVYLIDSENLVIKLSFFFKSLNELTQIFTLRHIYLIFDLEFRVTLRIQFLSVIDSIVLKITHKSRLSSLLKISWTVNDSTKKLASYI